MSVINTIMLAMICLMMVLTPTIHIERSITTSSQTTPLTRKNLITSSHNTVDRSSTLPTVFRQKSSSDNEAVSQFVTVNGTQFNHAGKEFSSIGVNNYYIAYSSRGMVDEVLSNTVSIGSGVIRTFAVATTGSLDKSVPSIDSGVGTDGGTSGAYFQYWDPISKTPQFNNGKDGLERLDYTLAEAGRRGIKLIVVLSNNWSNLGGIDQYVTWYDLPYHDDFFRDNQIKAAYKAWLSHIINRTNSITGVIYRDDPTIMAWELGNELACFGSGEKPSSQSCDTTLLVSWAKEMSSFIKAQDPNHLVAVGDSGLMNRPGDSDWAYNGSWGNDFEAYLALPTIDYGSFHLYDSMWNKNSEWGVQWIRDHVNVGTLAHKPVLLEEFGSSDLARRESIYELWTNTLVEEGSHVFLAWMLAGHFDNGSRYWDDGYTFFFPDTTTQLLMDVSSKLAMEETDDDAIIVTEYRTYIPTIP